MSLPLQFVRVKIVYLVVPPFCDISEKYERLVYTRYFTSKIKSVTGGSAFANTSNKLKNRLICLRKQIKTSAHNTCKLKINDDPTQEAKNLP